MRTQAPPMVGRAAESARMHAALRTAGDGDATILLITGEAGIGKTRLVEDLHAAAAADGWLCATGNCSPATGTRAPYGPIVDLIGDLRHHRPDLPDLLPPEVWRSVGLLTGLVPDPAHGAGLDIAAARLFAGFVETVATLGRHQRVLLVVEDLHWADAASIDLLLFAVRKLRHDRVLLVLTHRSVGPVDGVRRALAEFRRVGAVDITLAPLADADMSALLADLPRAPSRTVRDRITEVCGGIPFFALHWAVHGDGRSVPPGLRDVLLAALDGLSTRERAFLTTLAVMGDPSDGAALRAAASATMPEFNYLVRGLVERGLVVDRDEFLGFRHAILREVVVDTALPSERAAAHARVADGLLAASPADRDRRAGEIAHHLLSCDRPADAMRWALRAARRAAAVWAFTDACRSYAEVRRLWHTVADPEAVAGVGRAELIRESALAVRWCGRLDEALDLLDDGLRSAGTDAARAALEDARGQVLWATGDMAASLAAYERALALLPGTAGAGTRAAVLASVARGLVATGNATRAEQMARSAAGLATEAGADRERVGASITRAAAAAQLGRVEEAVSALRDCLPDCRRLDDLELVLRCYGNLTFALGTAGRYAELATVAAEATEVCHRYGPVVSLASTVVNNRAEALTALGRWDEAVAVAQEALRDGCAAGVAVHLRTRLVEVALGRGDVDEADVQLARMQELADNPYALSAISVARAHRALLVRDPARAAAVIAQVLPKLHEQDDPLPVLQACWIGLRATVVLAETAAPRRRSTAAPEAETFLATAGTAAGRTDVPAAAALYEACRAEGARMTGSDTAEQWQAVAAAGAALHRPHDHAYGLVRLGAVHLRRQARAAATRALAEALEVATALRAQPLVDEIGVLATVAGLRLTEPPRVTPVAAPAATEAGPPADGPGPSLTPRERQVLSLLATGATNRIIARSLFISERTASVHVHNILTKLGVANRTEAARIALQKGMDTPVRRSQ